MEFSTKRMDRSGGNLYNLAMTVDTSIPPPDILITGHFKEHPGYAVYRVRGSGNWLITWTLTGQGIYRQPGIEIVAQPGDLVLLQPGALHDYSVPPDASWEFFWAHFQPRPTWLSWWQLPSVGQGLFKIHVQAAQIQERIQKVFLQLHTDAIGHYEATQEPASILQRELALNGLEEILLLTTREYAPGYRHPIDERIQRVLEIIQHDFATQHSLEALAQAVSLSSSRLCHLFKLEVGDSINNVLISMRLARAARLLEFTTESVHHIAEQVGFSSAFYFSRQFHQRFGMSPREYRAALTDRTVNQSTPPDGSPLGH
jgi:AraC family transcriptional regulator, arabinose operon regulatory protein